MGSGIFLEHGVAKGTDLTATVYGFWLSLSVLMNAFILVGVDGWCSMQAATDYLELVEEKLWHPRSPGLQAVADVELRHRLRWVELTRGPEGLTLGEAIKTSMSELAGAWQYGPEFPVPSNPQGQKRKQPDKDKEHGYTIQESKGGVGQFVTCGTKVSARMVTSAPTTASTFVTSKGAASRIGGLTIGKVVPEVPLRSRSSRQRKCVLALVTKVAVSQILSHVRNHFHGVATSVAMGALAILFILFLWRLRCDLDLILKHF